MHKSAFAGLSILVIFTVTVVTPKAQALELSQDNTETISANQVHEAALASAKNISSKSAEYEIVTNDSLSKIAYKYDTTWKKIFNKNTSIKDPDVIFAGDELIIPKSNENLKDRSVSAETVLTDIKKPTSQTITPKRVQKTQPVVKRVTPKRVQSSVTQRVPTVKRGESSGNFYTPGYCTWFVKNQRSDLPNNLGNADTWVIRARAQGLATGSTPRAGAVGQRGMHVVYVKSVNKDGTVNISEMNHKGLWVITHRTLPGNYFQYIY
ncbi:MAG: LysM peptidoglycan-binding domain-containing protein [bacterium]|nr:LysM peptidoglycan-binding domain-containing protein [bacterium]